MRILFRTGDTFKEARKEKSIGKSIGILILAAAIAAIGTFLIVQQLGATAALLPQFGIGGLTTLALWGTAIAAFVLILVFGFFGGFLLKLVMCALGYKSRYFSGLTAISYPLLPLSVGFLIAVLLNYIPLIGSIIGFFVAAIFIVISFGAAFRGIKELFASDYIAALVGFIVIWMALTLATYLSTIGLLGGMANILPGLSGFGLPGIPS